MILSFEQAQKLNYGSRLLCPNWQDVSHNPWYAQHQFNKSKGPEMIAYRECWRCPYCGYTVEHRQEVNK